MAVPAGRGHCWHSWVGAGDDAKHASVHRADPRPENNDLAQTSMAPRALPAARCLARGARSAHTGRVTSGSYVAAAGSQAAKPRIARDVVTAARSDNSICEQTSWGRVPVRDHVGCPFPKAGGCCHYPPHPFPIKETSPVPGAQQALNERL